ncbi:LysR family transcriptional regulator substrate-binding protein [Streptomyces luteogriseus]|uniref:LysR family transcriptional regulator substrate-binding protein n=1 Tax=Streptomyces luteogriseus TaxID=68233 RepID=UPI0037B18283
MCARLVERPLHRVGSGPELTVTCLVADQAQLRELTLGAVDVVQGQRYRGITACPTPHPGASRSYRCSTIRCSSSPRPAKPPERPVALRERAAHSLVLPPPTTDCGQAIVHACHQAGFTPTTRYITADIAARVTLARAGLASGLVPRTAIDPAAPGISTASITDHRSCVCCSPRRVTPRPPTRRPRPSSQRCAPPRGTTAPRAFRRPRRRRRAAGGSDARSV